MKEQEQVKEFMEAVGQECPTAFSVIPKEKIDLRLNLIQEELNELTEAFGYQRVEGRTRAIYHEDRYDKVAIADAIGDLLYVILGAANAVGLDVEPIFDEIHKSNMTKVIDGYRDENGKWRKGPSYKEPQLEEIVGRQS